MKKTGITGFGILWFLITACGFIHEAAGQEIFEGRIFYVQGAEFTLVRAGEQQTYGPEVLIAVNRSLRNGDILRTGPGSSLEFQFLPDGTGIKVAENTSLQLSRREGRTPVITLSYGRIRVVPGFHAPDPAVYVRAGNGEAGVQTGDFGVDYTITEANFPAKEGDSLKPTFHLYNFRGFSEITVRSGAGRESQPDLRPDEWPVIPVSEGEWVSLEVNASLSLLKRRPLEMEIVTYWNQNNFQGTPPLAMPNTVLTWGAAPPDPKFEFTASQRRLTRIKNMLIISGLSLTVAGIAAQAAGYSILNPSNPTAARNQVNLGFIPVGLGISAIIASIFFNPAFP
ncbi:MAG: FecR family protein [Spirochaetaceae bacterium]|nr:FecR family protein [Spirochaetaceae bacterium]